MIKIDILDILEELGYKLHKVNTSKGRAMVGKDLCRVLGYTNNRAVLKAFVSPQNKFFDKVLSDMGKQNTIMLTDAGMLELISRGKLPKSKAVWERIKQEAKRQLMGTSEEGKVVMLNDRESAMILCLGN